MGKWEMPDIDGQLFVRFLNQDAQDALEVIFDKYRDSLILFHFCQKMSNTTYYNGGIIWKIIHLKKCG